MGISEKRMRDILGSEIQVSDIVDQRLQETYLLLENTENRPVGLNRRKNRRKNFRAAAVAAVIVCLGIPSVVYASVKSGFFEGMFGNDTKKSTDVIHTEIDNGKGGTTAVDIPSKEYVPVDPQKAENMIGQWVMDEPVVTKIGRHTLTVQSFACDKHAAFMYFTLEREGGVTALAGNMDTNLTKGAYFTEDADFYFRVEASGEITGADNIYVDAERSTGDKLYCSSYILWPEGLKEGDSIELVIDKYPGAARELYAMTDEEKAQEWQEQIKTERIPLTIKGQIPVQCIDLGNDGFIEYSPVSICVDMSKGLGLSEEEAGDPYYMKHLEIKYKDGSSYVIQDDTENINNSGYVLGTEEGYKTAFNRLVDTDQIAEIIVNDVSFPAQQ